MAEALSEAGIDAFFAFDSRTLRYLHDFDEEAHERLMVLAVSPSGAVRLIAPALSESQARRSGIEDVRSWADGEDPMPLFEALAQDWGLRTGILAVDPALPARHLLRVQDALPAALFRDGEALLDGLMRRKQPEELERMRRAARIADEAYEAILPKLEAGQTELQIQRMIFDEMAARGGNPTFCIVAAGANSAEPHHASDDTVVRAGDVLLLDFGCGFEGYQSDITRVVAVEHASDRAKAMYDLVYRAHRAGVEAVRPGVPASEIDAATRGVIVAAGEGAAFFHRTGHGIGLNGHEGPYISAANEAPLEPGNCFSVEPGVYFRGEFGIRIETIMAVTESGGENLNAPALDRLQIVG
jgi:Xaa-Pro aminopeptidase